MTKLEKKLCCLTLMAGLMTLVSCEKKDYSSYPPTWKGFELSSKTVHPGDSITVTAVQDDKGHLINSTYYTWYLTCNITDGNSTISYTSPKETVHTNYDGTDNGNPSYTLYIPENAAPGNGTIYFTAKYNYSGGGIQVSSGMNYSETGLSGYISSESGSISGGASGNVSFRIVE